MDQSVLPDRLREKAFRRFERDIGSIVKAYPHAVLLDPSKLGLAPTTYVARLRDAMASLFTYRWKTDLDISKFVEFYQSIRVCHTKDGIFSGSRESIQASIEREETALRDMTLPPPKNTIKFTTRAEMVELCKLVATAELKQHVIVSGLPDSEAQYLSENFDVRLDKNKDNTYTLI